MFFDAEKRLPAPQRGGWRSGRAGQRLFRGRWGDAAGAPPHPLEQRRAFATSIAIILPLCALSSVIYWVRGGLDFGLALPYLAGGLLGGFVGGRVFKKLNMVWLRRAFALLILYGGVKALFF